MLDGMTNIKASEVLKEIKYYTEDLPPYSPDEVAEALEMAIKALEQQPCEDCISREEVQDLISRWLSDYLLDETREALETINYKVGDMPPVKPKRPKGEWIEYCGGLQCSECGWEVDDEYYLGQRVACPNCGADMSGGGEDV